MVAQEGTELGLNGWEHFVQSPFWGAVIHELREREQYIVELLKEGGDTKWSDDNMRGRINELEFVSQVPLSIMLAIKATSKKATEENNEQNEKE